MSGQQKAIISKGAGQWVANVHEGELLLYTVATGDTFDEARAHLEQWMEERGRQMPVEVVRPAAPPANATFCDCLGTHYRTCRYYAEGR